MPSLRSSSAPRRGGCADYQLAGRRPRERRPLCGGTRPSSGRSPAARGQGRPRQGALRPRGTLSPSSSAAAARRRVRRTLSRPTEGRSPSFRLQGRGNSDGRRLLRPFATLFLGEGWRGGGGATAGRRRIRTDGRGKSEREAPPIWEERRRGGECGARSGRWPRTLSRSGSHSGGRWS